MLLNRHLETFKESSESQEIQRLDISFGRPKPLFMLGQKVRSTMWNTLKAMVSTLTIVIGYECYLLVNDNP